MPKQQGLAGGSWPQPHSVIVKAGALEPMLSPMAQLMRPSSGISCSVVGVVPGEARYLFEPKPLKTKHLNDF